MKNILEDTRTGKLDNPGKHSGVSNIVAQENLIGTLGEHDCQHTPFIIFRF